MGKILRAIVEKYSEVLTDRQKLRALLMDYFPQNKQACNLLLMAYDEDIHNQLRQGGALGNLALSRYVKILESHYAVNRDNAKQTVWAWAYALNVDFDDESDTGTSANRKQASATPSSVANAQGNANVWYYVDNSRKSIGPFSVDEMAALFENGIISRDTFVWAVGFDNWVKAEETELSQYNKPSPVVSAKVTTVLGNRSDYEMTKDANGIVIEEFIGVTKPEIVIPNLIDGEPVYAIGDGTCKEKFTGIKSIVISDGIRHIEPYAFFECSGLQKVVFPGSLQSIAFGAFWRCEALTSVSFPDSLQSIDSGAFYGCKALTIHCTVGSCAEQYARINNHTTILGKNASSVKKTTVWVRSGDYEIEKNVNGVILKRFVGIKSPEIVIPNSIDGEPVYAIGDCAFDSGNDLKDDAYKSNHVIERIVISDGIRHIGRGAFAKCSNLQTARLPDGLQSIDRVAFWLCHKLTKATIPDSVQSISNNAFDDCENLTIYCTAGSYAERYARGNNIKYARK